MTLKIHSKELLKNIKILDFSNKLPGPMAGSLLAKLGAKVTKIEDINMPDPYFEGFYSEMNDGFKSWYKKINSSKQIIRMNFDNLKEIEALRKLIAEADAIIMGLNRKNREKVSFSTIETKNQVRINIRAFRENNSSMHDLNAMAISGVLPLYLHSSNKDFTDPPFLPMAGAAFGQRIASELLAGLILSHKQNQNVEISCSLYESTKDFFSALWDKDFEDRKVFRFLHNGAYPCYSIYRTKDNKWAALGAAEQKFWERFCEAFCPELKELNRFSEEENGFIKVANVFKKLHSQEIEEKLKDLDCCLNLVE